MVVLFIRMYCWFEAHWRTSVHTVSQLEWRNHSHSTCEYRDEQRDWCDFSLTLLVSGAQQSSPWKTSNRLSSLLLTMVLLVNKVISLASCYMSSSGGESRVIYRMFSSDPASSSSPSPPPAVACPCRPATCHSHFVHVQVVFNLQGFNLFHWWTSVSITASSARCRLHLFEWLPISIINETPLVAGQQREMNLHFLVTLLN